MGGTYYCEGLTLVAESGLCERGICRWEPRAVDSGAAKSRKYKNHPKGVYPLLGFFFTRPVTTPSKFFVFAAYYRATVDSAGFPAAYPALAQARLRLKSQTLL